MFFKRLLFRSYLDKGETLLYVISPHWISIKNLMMKIGFFGYGLPIFMLIFFSGLAHPLSLFFYAWLVISVAYTIYAFMDWYMDAWLLTDVSIIETIWDGFFKQSSSRIEYASIESVDVEVKGIQQTLLNYGNIILIKSSGINIRMGSISRPQMAASWISRIRSEALLTKNAQNSESIKSLLADIIESHIKVNS